MHHIFLNSNICEVSIEHTTLADIKINTNSLDFMFCRAAYHVILKNIVINTEKIGNNILNILAESIEGG